MGSLLTKCVRRLRRRALLGHRTPLRLTREAPSPHRDHPAAPASPLSPASRRFPQDHGPRRPPAAGRDRGPLLSRGILLPVSWGPFPKKPVLSRKNSQMFGPSTAVRIPPPGRRPLLLPSVPQLIHQAEGPMTPSCCPIGASKEAELRAQEQQDEGKIHQDQEEEEEEGEEEKLKEKKEEKLEEEKDEEEEEKKDEEEEEEEGEEEKLKEKKEEKLEEEKDEEEEEKKDEEEEELEEKEEEKVEKEEEEDTRGDLSALEPSSWPPEGNILPERAQVSPKNLSSGSPTTCSSHCPAQGVLALLKAEGPSMLHKWTQEPVDLPVSPASQDAIQGEQGLKPTCVLAQSWPSLTAASKRPHKRKQLMPVALPSLISWHQDGLPPPAKRPRLCTNGTLRRVQSARSNHVEPEAEVAQGGREARRTAPPLSIHPPHLQALPGMQAPSPHPLTPPPSQPTLPAGRWNSNLLGP
ncbi:Hypothetical predicted protein [Marmota monax]|uniref:Uncharacterized protein n=1 Tax=Marmota monax TaxID=9995 RepID=A0A5E4BIV1_MARMO|nr:Hypothetical predicted protein [Marmota monax]